MREFKVRHRPLCEVSFYAQKFGIQRFIACNQWFYQDTLSEKLDINSAVV